MHLCILLVILIGVYLTKEYSMKLFTLSITLLRGVFSIVSAQWLPVPDFGGTILNDNVNQAVNTDLADDPLRDWIYNIVTDGTNSIENISSNNTQIEDFGTAQNSTLTIVTNIINWLLWILALVSLLYLLYHGFLILTARDDEEQYKTGIQGIKYATIALLWIWLSRFIVSMIFYFISIITV